MLWRRCSQPQGRDDAGTTARLWCAGADQGSSEPSTPLLIGLAVAGTAIMATAASLAAMLYARERRFAGSSRASHATASSIRMHDMHSPVAPSSVRTHETVSLELAR
jgi:hypothetical protein